MGPYHLHVHRAQTYRATFAVFTFDQLRVLGGHNGGVIAMMETNTYLSIPMADRRILCSCTSCNTSAWICFTVHSGMDAVTYWRQTEEYVDAIRLSPLFCRTLVRFRERVKNSKL